MTGAPCAPPRRGRGACAGARRVSSIRSTAVCVTYLNHPQFIGKTKLIKEVSNLTHTEINELNKLGIKLKFFGKNEVIIPIFEEIKIAFTSGILDKNYIPNLENLSLKVNGMDGYAITSTF